MVKAVISGQHIADGHRDQIIVGVVEAEQLEADEQGGDGAVGHPAEDSHHADGGAQRGVGADEGREQAAEGGPGEKRGHDLPALEAGPDGEGGEQDLQEESQRGGLAGQRPLDDVHAGPQIIVGLNQQGQQDEKDAAHSRAQIGVFEKSGVLGLEKAHGPAEQDAHQGAENCQNDDAEGGGQVQLQRRPDFQVVEGGMQGAGQQKGGEGGPDAGHQGGVVHHPDAGDLHGQKSRRHGGPEEGGKSGGNPAHQDDLPVLFVEPEFFPQLFPDAAADLHGRPFPPYGAAEEDRQEGGDENQPAHPQRDMGLLMDAVDHRIGSRVVFIVKRFVQKDDEKARQRQEQKDPGMGVAEIHRGLQAEIEQGADGTHHEPRDRGKKQPPEKLKQIAQAAVQSVIG